MGTSEPDKEPETCSICPSAGPPRKSTTTLIAPTPNGSTTPDDDQDEAELEWVACHKCDKWYHIPCVVFNQDFKATSLPEELRVEIDASSEGIWYDWTARVDRWYCEPCIVFSTSPDNPRPPRQPLATTLKKSRKKRPSTSGSPTSKRARLQPATASSSVNGSEPPTAEVASAEGRPKRKAALDRPDYLNMHNHNPTPTKAWLDLIKDPKKHGRVIMNDNFPRVPGSLLRKEWIESGTSASDVSVGTTAPPAQFPPTLFYGPTREPLVVRAEDGGLTSMGGMVPDPSLTVDDVARLVGPDKMVDVIDVATQQSSQWPLSKWAAYVKARADPGAAGSSKVYNIISLEISGTELAKHVRVPRIVSEIDWVENFWHFPGGKDATMRARLAEEAGEPLPMAAGKGKVRTAWPKVQLYCLMGMKDSWTDWHVDFAASSVYYSIHTGCKVFFFIRPTDANLAAFAQWSGSEDLQQSTWLPDMCDEVRKVTLHAGDTMIIPAGYIHAVYTPVDSIVFGGNFVHSYDIPTQLRTRQIEIDTGVPLRQRFPFFDKLCWYVAQSFVSTLRDLRAYKPNSKAVVVRPHERVLRGLVVLARFLVQETDVLEDAQAEDKKRKSIWNRVPAEVDQPAALAHELLWRAERELPDAWEDEDEVKVASSSKKRKTAPVKQQPATGKKGMKLLDRPQEARVWQFSPAPWDQAEHPINQSTTAVRLPRPGLEAAGEEEARQDTATYHQSRVRVKADSGEVVREEQDIVFTETRVTWPAGAEGSGVANSEVKAEDGVVEPSSGLPAVLDAGANGST